MRQCLTTWARYAERMLRSSYPFEGLIVDGFAAVGMAGNSVIITLKPRPGVTVKFEIENPDRDAINFAVMEAIDASEKMEMHIL